MADIKAILKAIEELSSDPTIETPMLIDLLTEARDDIDSRLDALKEDEKKGEAT